MIDVLMRNFLMLVKMVKTIINSCLSFSNCKHFKVVIWKIINSHNSINFLDSYYKLNFYLDSPNTFTIKLIHISASKGIGNLTYWDINSDFKIAK